MNKILWVIVISLFFSFGAYAAEQDFVEGLNLSKKQVKQIRLKQKKNIAEQFQIQKRLAISERALKKELAKTDSDEKKIKELSTKINKLQGEKLGVKIKGFVELKKVMTREQLKKMEKIRESNKKDKSSKFRSGSSKKKAVKRKKGGGRK
jgi:ubiquinone biosynthesis protein UbiJ